MHTDQYGGDPGRNSRAPEYRPRIVFVITRGDSIGGAQVHVRDLTTQIRADGGDPLVIVGSCGVFTDDLTHRGIRWKKCPALTREMNPVRDARAIRQVHQTLLRERPDLISAHTAKAGMVGRIAAIWAGTPSLFTAHGWQFAPGIGTAQRLFVYLIEVALSRLTSRVITVSHYDLRLARRSGAVPAARLRLVYNGLPDTPLRSTPDRTGDPGIVMIARFQNQKDHATLLKALADLSTGWKLILVGEPGPTSDTVAALIEELRISETPDFTVHLLGHRSDIAEILADAQLYCLISRWEGLPRSIIEGMRAGLPVVATAVGGVAELVQDGVTGYLVAREDTRDVHRRIEELACNPALRASMGQRGRTRYEARFTFHALYRKTVAVWKEVARRADP